MLKRVDNQFQFGQLIEAPHPQVGDQFGRAFIFNKNWLFVAAPDGFSNNATTGPASVGPGNAYLYAPSDQGFVNTTKLSVYNADIGDNFGYAVALTDKYAVCTAPREDGGANGVQGNAADNTKQDSGAVYIFE